MSQSPRSPQRKHSRIASVLGNFLGGHGPDGDHNGGGGRAGDGDKDESSHFSGTGASHGHGMDQRGLEGLRFANGVRPLPKGSVTVDWHLVLNELQREKKRAIARKEEQYSNRSCFFLESSSRLREGLIKVVEWPYFDNMILLLILTNCVFLVLDDPICRCLRNDCSEAERYEVLLYNKDCSSWASTRNFLQQSEYVFTALFTAEMVMKIVARGFLLHKHAYLRDGWNWIDFVVVVTSLITLDDNVQAQWSVLRTIRVLRPLRTLTRIKGMRPLINTFLRSFQALGNVVMLLFFFLLVYGILGIELLSGTLRGRCYFDPLNNEFSEHARSRLESQQTPYLVETQSSEFNVNGGVSVCSLDPDPTQGFRCTPFSIDGEFYNTTCSTRFWCGTRWCDANWNPNPRDLGGGWLSYDNIGQAFLILFQTLTNEGWTDILYLHSDGWNKWNSRVFHSSWVLIGAFFVVQLALAVLSHSFVQAQEEEKTEREREALHFEAILRVPPSVAKTRNVQQQATKRSYTMATSMSLTSLPDTGSRDNSNEGMTAMERIQVTYMYLTSVKNAKLLAAVNRWNLVRQDVQTYCRILVSSTYFQNFVVFAILLNTLCLGWDFHDQKLFEDNICRRRCELDPALPAAASDKCLGPLFNHTWNDDGMGGGEKRPQLGKAYCFMDATLDVPASTECAEEDTPSSCYAKSPDCFWFDGSDQPCKRGMYSYQTIAHDGARTLSFRHFCGDDGALCPTYPVMLNEAVTTINAVLTFVFIGEMVFKMLGLGIREYFDDRFNVFDFFVVMASIVDIVYDTGGSNSSGSSLSALRGVRLFRLFKLARSWKSMRKILTTMGVALASLGPLTIVWVMFMYIFALLGMQYFGGTFKHLKTDTPRSNFDGFGPSSTGHGAFIVTFQIISTENWNTILFNCITAYGTPLTSLLTITIVIFGNYIIMNLFISILLQGFDEDDEREDEEGDQSTHGSRGPAATLAAKFRALLGKSSARIAGAASIRRRRPTQSPSPHMVGQPPPMKKQLTGIEALRDLSAFASGIEHNKPDDEVTVFGKKVLVANHKAFGFIPRNNVVRTTLAYIVKHSMFDYFILVCILITSVTLIIENPADTIIANAKACPDPPGYLDCSGLEPGQTSQINCPRSILDDDWGKTWGPCGSADEPECCTVVHKLEVFMIMDMLFTLLFCAEMVVKMVADGVILHEKAYLRDPWNWLDCVIVVMSMFSTFGGEYESVKALKSLRAVRALRPLRVIKRNPAIKIAVVSLLSSIPAMLNVAVVFLLWFSMYAMLGVQLFKGELYKCVDEANMLFYGTAWFPSGSLYTAMPPMSGPKAIPTIIECASMTEGKGTWQDKYSSFNNYYQALLTLFQMATTEGWMDIMSATVDTTGMPGVTPLPNINAHACWYSVGHIVVGAFVLLNLIVGSIINNYNRIKTSSEGIPPFLTVEQQEWKETKKLIYQLKPKRRIEGPPNPIRNLLFRVADSQWFEYLITTVILANVVVMTMKTHDESQCFTAAKVWANISFTTVFVLEAVVKVIALGPRWYLRDGWNCFDVAVAMLSVVSIGFDIASNDYTCDPALNTSSNSIPALQVLRAFRIARVFRLIRRAKGLRNMIQTLIVSLPALANITSLIILFMIIFAVLGNTVFYNVNTNQDFYGRLDDDNGNYATFDNALWILHRQTTGEAWDGIMFYCSQLDPFKACAKTYGDFFADGCGGPEIGIAFHVFWQLFGTYLMMQLFTAVILENFDDLAKEDSSIMPVDKLNEFVCAWTELDPEAEEAIHSARLPELIKKLDPPLGVKGKGESKGALLQVIKDLAIPIHGDKVYYKDTFLACVKRVMSHGNDDDDDDDDMLEASTSFTPRTRKGYQGKDVTVAEDFAARLVQRAYRDWREKKMQVVKAVGKTKLLPIEPHRAPIVSW